jgi:hypothetical protein
MLTVQRNSLPALLQDPSVDAICAVEAGPRSRFDIYVNQDPDHYHPPDLGGYDFKTIPLKKHIQALGIQMGTSTSNTLTCAAGTLGVKVVDNTNPNVTGYITCNHVATGVGGCFKGDAKDQVAPATCDRPNCIPGTPIGTVVRWAPISKISNTNDADAAFVSSPSVDAENYCGLCSTTSAPSDPATLLGQSLMKCGRTTGLTCGLVTGVGCTVRVRYEQCGFVEFIDQIRVESPNFAISGDSGSVAYTTSGSVVGLVFAGDDDRTTFLNPMTAVLSELNVSLVLARCGSQPACPDVNSEIVSGCPNAPAPPPPNP